MKLALIYNVWCDAIELLEGSIKQIESECDYIIINWQAVSNCGEGSEDISEQIERLNTNPKYILSEFTPTPSIAPGFNERRKRQQGVNLARKTGATHYLHIDCDEYYNTWQFIKAKQAIIDGCFDSSACKLFTYFKEPTWQLTPIEPYYVPFIHSINLISTNDYPVYCDPTRRAKGKHFKEFTQDELMMHHYSWVRNDIGLKLRNSSASVNWAAKMTEYFRVFNDFKFGDKMPPYEEFELKKVDNFFDI